jgi:hypothetical protein
MLEQLNPETVCRIIAGAREFQSQEEVVLPDVPDSPSEDWALQALAEHTDDLTFQEMKAAIDDLEPDQQVALVALMWTGRGDFSAEEWGDALAAAQENWTPRTAEYLLATPLVADFLGEGLSQLGYSCEND